MYDIGLRSSIDDDIKAARKRRRRRILTKEGPGLLSLPLLTSKRSPGTTITLNYN